MESSPRIPSDYTGSFERDPWVPTVVICKRSTTTLGLTVLAQACYVNVTIEVSVNRSTGEEVLSVSINDIITLTGQTILPAALSLDELRLLMRTIRERSEHLL